MFLGFRSFLVIVGRFLAVIRWFWVFFGLVSVLFSPVLLWWHFVFFWGGSCFDGVCGRFSVILGVSGVVSVVFSAVFPFSLLFRSFFGG